MYAAQLLDEHRLAHVRVAVFEQTRHAGARRRCQQGFERFDSTRVIDPPILAQLRDPCRSVERHNRVQCFVPMCVRCHRDPISMQTPQRSTRGYLENLETDGHCCGFGIRSGNFSRSCRRVELCHVLRAFSVGPLSDSPFVLVKMANHERPATGGLVHLSPSVMSAFLGPVAHTSGEPGESFGQFAAARSASVADGASFQRCFPATDETCARASTLKLRTARSAGRPTTPRCPSARSIKS